MRSSEDDLTAALAKSAAPLVDKLKERIDLWKPRREDTIKALRELATKCDAKYKRNNAVKLTGAVTGVLGTVAGVGLCFLTAGMATPIVVGVAVGGVAVAAGAGVAVGVGDYLNSVCSEEAREETQKTLDKEKNPYGNVRLVAQELQETLEYTCNDHGWPQDAGLAKLLSYGISCKVEVAGITIEGGQRTAQFLIAGLTATEMITSYKEAIEAAKAAAEGADEAAKGAKAAAEAAKKAGNLEAFKEASAAADAAKDAAAAARKNFKTGKGAINATKKAVAAGEAAAKAAGDASEAVSKLANSAMKGARAAKEFVKAAADGAAAAGKGANAAKTGVKIVSRTGIKALGKAVPFLNVAFLLLDAKDAVEAGYQLAKGESKVGHHVRSKAEELQEELAYVEEMYQRLKAAV